MNFSSLEDEVQYLRVMLRVTRLADEILEDCLERQLGLSAALDVFLAHAARMVHAQGGFVEVRGSGGPVMTRVVGRPGLEVERALGLSGAVRLDAEHTLFVKPLTLGRLRVGSLGVTLRGQFEDGGERVMALVDVMGEQLDTALLSFLAVSEERNPLERLDALSEQRAFSPRARVGHYELVKPLGTGGMAQVMLARAVGPEGLYRLVALKRILPNLCADPLIVRQFLEEARIGLRLSHPNVVTVYDFGQADGSYYIAMELVRGAELGDLLHKVGPLAPRLAVTVLTQALAGLHAAHEVRADNGSLLNLVHRDLSPQNLMVGFDGRVKLLDFGVAKARWQLSVTLPGLVKGKPMYMSPEQATGDALDRRSDLFAMGLILYELLTGVRPFARQDDAASMNAIVREPLPLNERIPPELWDVLQRALHKEPGQRYRDAAEFARELARVADPYPEAELGRLVSIHFPERLRSLFEKEHPAPPPPDVSEERTEIRKRPGR